MIRVLVLPALLVLMAGPAWAEDGVLDGTLLAVRNRGSLRIGYRESAAPFASATPSGPAGFSVDLCREVAVDVAEALHQDDIRMEYVPVAADQRLPAVMSGQIDIECGSTTANAERARSVAFSPVFFLAGTKLLVRAGSGVGSVQDLAGQTAAAAAGTTNADVLRRVLPPTAKLVTPDIEGAYRMVQDGTAAAMASDDVLLAGLVAAHKDGTTMAIVGDYLSYEPYALAFRRDDPAFAALVRTTFTRLSTSGRLIRLYDQWITTPLALPLGPHLAEMYRALGE